MIQSMRIWVSLPGEDQEKNSNVSLGFICFLLVVVWFVSVLNSYYLNQTESEEGTWDQVEEAILVETVSKILTFGSRNEQRGIWKIS